MGRLEQYQKRKLNRTIYLSLFVLIGVIIFLATVGLNIVLNASSFIARFSEEKTDSKLIKNQNLIEDIDIESVPLATNSARIIVGGSVVNFNQVEFYLNDELVKETDLVSSDSFNEEIGDLEKGKNEVYVIGKSRDSEDERKSKVYTVIFKDEKPKLNIKEPNDGQKTNNNEIRVVGETDKETYIKVNDLPIVVDAQGIFQTNVRLKEGENKIKVVAQDIAENIEEKILTVIYEKD